MHYYNHYFDIGSCVAHAGFQFAYIGKDDLDVLVLLCLSSESQDCEQTLSCLTLSALWKHSFNSCRGRINTFLTLQEIKMPECFRA